MAIKRKGLSLNRKQRKELARRLRSEDPGLEVMHPDAAGIDVGNSAHDVAVRPVGVLHGRLTSYGGLVTESWREDRGDAIHRRLLDSPFRDPGKGEDLRCT